MHWGRKFFNQQVQPIRVSSALYDWELSTAHKGKLTSSFLWKLIANLYFLSFGKCMCTAALWIWLCPFPKPVFWIPFLLQHSLLWGCWSQPVYAHKKGVAASTCVRFSWGSASLKSELSFTCLNHDTVSFFCVLNFCLETMDFKQER